MVTGIVKKLLRNILRIRHIRGIHNECFAPGHYYSPVVSIKHAKQRESDIWKKFENTIPDIDLTPQKQIELLGKFYPFYAELPFNSSNSGNRYYFDNEFYSYTDAIILYSILRNYKPIRIIEAGSGFSSAAMFDIREKFNLDIELHLIEPYPQRLKSLLKKEDYQYVNIHQQAIQDFDMSQFERLEKGDIFFIDSTHISKTGSDVNHILFNILPKLKKGVFIHFHDIFYPFEYPKSWVFEGRSWNENYIIRAFLMNNKNYEILFFSDYIHKCFPSAFEKMPLCYKNPGGSLWLRKNIV